MIRDAIESEHKILLFSSYTSMFEIIEKELEKLNIEYFKLVGNTLINKRIEMVDEFNKNESVKKDIFFTRMYFRPAPILQRKTFPTET